jgi:hypothetical protein
MDWLEISPAELPTRVACRRCGQDVELTLSQEDLQARQAVAPDAPVAFPVVPCVAVGSHPAPPQARSAERPALSQAESLPTQPPMEVSRPAKTWSVTLLDGTRYTLDRDRMNIGRSRDCEIVLSSSRVSRNHALILREGDGFAIEDLGSANGVYLHSERISRQLIKPGDVYTISDETLTFDVS